MAENERDGSSGHRPLETAWIDPPFCLSRGPINIHYQPNTDDSNHALSGLAPAAPSKGWYSQASEASKHHKVTYIVVYLVDARAYYVDFVGIVCFLWCI